MGDHTGIEWTDATWNPIVGCSIVSPGCTNCYAMKQAARLLDGNPKAPHYAGTTRSVNGHAVWTGKVALAPDHILTQPLRWQKPRRIFVNSMGDLFHEDVPDEWIDMVFAVMALTPHHTYQVLTKRSARMRKYMSPTTPAPILGRLPLERVHFAAGEEAPFWENLQEYGNLYSLYCSVPWPLPNVWLGVSAERQQEWDERVYNLYYTSAAIRFTSVEPMLGPIKTGFRRGHGFEPGIDWVIAGGESGPGARPMHPDWARSLRDQCADAGVPFYFKQWGEWADAESVSSEELEAFDVRGLTGDGVVRVGKKRAGRLLDGVEHSAFPRARA